MTIAKLGKINDDKAFFIDKYPCISNILHNFAISGLRPQQIKTKSTMAIYLDPKADLTFKKVFGEHKELMISFLNAMLPLPDNGQVAWIEYLEPELIPDQTIDEMHLIFIELSKFKPHTFHDKKMMVLWLRYLTEINEKTRQAPAELLENPNTCKALDKVDEVQRKLHEAQADAKLAKAEGEKAKALAIARNMIADSMLTEVIAKYTGLTEEEIESLLQ